MTRLALLTIFVSVCLAQQPAFEAASVKPAAPAVPGVDYRDRGGPGTEDPGQITWPLTTMLDLIMRAYGVDLDQVAGPAWIGVAHYSVVAKLPPNTGKDEFRLMLQGLLAERFHLAFHRETREVAGYDLVVAGSAPKMKPAAPDNAVAPPSPPSGRGMETDDRGFPPLRPGDPFALAVGGGNAMVRSRNRMTMAQLADWLGSGGMINLANHDTGTTLGALPLRPRVIDRTGLSGTFDFTLEFAGGYSFQLQNLPLLAGRGAKDAAGDPAGPTIFVALEKQLGLKLVKARNVPLEVIVIDQVDRVPTEN